MFFLTVAVFAGIAQSLAGILDASEERGGRGSPPSFLGGVKDNAARDLLEEVDSSKTGSTQEELDDTQGEDTSQEQNEAEHHDVLVPGCARTPSADFFSLEERVLWYLDAFLIRHVENCWRARGMIATVGKFGYPGWNPKLGFGSPDYTALFEEVFGLQLLAQSRYVGSRYDKRGVMQANYVEFNLGHTGSG